MILNPYGIEVNIAAQGATADKRDDQVLSPIYFIKSETDAALRVSATVTGEVAGEVKLNETPITGADPAVTTKSAFMYFEIDNATDGTTEPTWASSFTDGDKQIAISARGATKNNMITMGQGDTAATFAAFRVTGDAVETPERGTWTADDKVNVTIAFTFTPTNSANAGGGGSGSTSHNITEGTHVDASSDITTVTFKVGGTAATAADKDDTVTIEVAATTGKTLTASVNGGSAINLTESSGTYTGTFTMPDADAEVIITVA